MTSSDWFRLAIGAGVIAVFLSIVSLVLSWQAIALVVSGQDATNLIETGKTLLFWSVLNGGLALIFAFLGKMKVNIDE